MAVCSIDLNWPAYMHAHAHTHSHICKHAHLRTRTRIHTRTHARTCTHTDTYTYARARTHTHAHVHIRTHTHTYTYAHTHNVLLAKWGITDTKIIYANWWLVIVYKIYCWLKDKIYNINTISTSVPRQKSSPCSLQCYSYLAKHRQ